MRLTIVALCSALMFFVYPCLGQASEGRFPYTPAQYLKNYAFSVCLAGGYESLSQSVYEDAAAAANGYLMLGSFGLDAYHEAADMAEAFLKKIYVSKKGRELVLMKCIDFYNSEQLNELARKYEQRR